MLLTVSPFICWNESPVGWYLEQSLWAVYQMGRVEPSLVGLMPLEKEAMSSSCHVRIEWEIGHLPPEGPPQKSATLAPWSQTFSLQDCEKFSHPVRGYFDTAAWSSYVSVLFVRMCSFQIVLFSGSLPCIQHPLSALRYWRCLRDSAAGNISSFSRLPLVAECTCSPAVVDVGF